MNRDDTTVSILLGMFLTVMVLLFLSLHTPNARTPEMVNRDKRLNLAELSYNSGCLISAIRSCSKIEVDQVKFSCYDSANAECPKMAKEFRKWLEDGK